MRVASPSGPGPILIQIAMGGEAAPLLAGGQFEPVSSPSTSEAEAEDQAYGFLFHTGRLRADGERVIVAVAGKHARFGADAIGTIPAALLAHTAIDRFSPRLVINAGTAGGFVRRGAAIGDVYIGDEVTVFHDRRIPLDGFRAMGLGHFPIHTPRALAETLGLKVGIVSTGDSLDCTDEDDRQMASLGATLKDMEAASIAYVCEHRKVPLLLLKSVTDLVDVHEASTAEQFLANYRMATERLAAALVRVVGAFALDGVGTPLG
jgi:5'-methylthioadenosine nucleosidase